MKQFLLALACVCMTSFLWGQRTLTGTITNETDEPLIGASVYVKGNPSSGTITDFEGQFELRVSEDAEMLVISYTGYETREVEIGASNTVNVTLSEGVTLDEAVVTALGVEREEKALGYAVQKLDGDEVSKVKDGNFINSLSGKVSGVDIRGGNQMGGSANVLIRGYKSLTGNNQPLFVVDGTPISNAITNTANQRTGRGGYDFGNAAMDINPDDVASISVLKGAAASALYGSRAANGVIMITTKKGRKSKDVGVTLNSSYRMGMIDQSTMPVYQKEYGAGYGQFYDDGPNGAYWVKHDIDGDGTEELAIPMGEDASYGAPFDPDLEVYTWESIHPELETFGQPQPWVGAENDATNSFYETMNRWTNSIAFDGGTETSTYRVSFTNMTTNGVVPNSRLVRNNVSLSGSHDFTDRLTVGTNINFVKTDARGRYGTGYDNRNPNQSFRQWYQTNVDMDRQREAYEKTGLNLSWNPYGYGAADPTGPHYFDNYYFNAYENVPTDGRNRLYGNAELKYELTSWLDFLARFSLDTYDELQEERIAVGSVDVPMYSRYNRNFTETNTDLLLNFNQYFGADAQFNLSGTVGANFRRTALDDIRAQTNGGLVVPGVYSLSNSVSPIEAPDENNYEVGVNGYFARASLGFNNFLYLDLTGRYDYSSTLPADQNAYFYPSASLSFVFSELINSDVIDFGKLSINYAEVGNDAPPQSVRNYYDLNTPFAGVPLASVANTENNPDLRPENTRSIEVGLQMRFINNRIGFNATWYRSNTFDQIIPVRTSASTGALFKYVNAGNIQNQGIELGLHLTPVRSANFSWDIDANWTKNVNEVVELFEGQTNLQLASVQGGVTINATEGEPYGALWGTNFVYHDNGEPIIIDHPFGGARYQRTARPEVIGNIQPDWKMGINNSLTFGNVSLSFLVDFQQGGNFFSLDTYYGYATGLYDITAGTNSKGNPVRDNPEDGGGIELDGVREDGSPNEEFGYMDDVYSALGYVVAPNAYHVYDASFVKLRELALTYSLPSRIFSNAPIAGIDISLTGRNLWIIHKNSPYSDPEAGLSAGNIQGNQSGAYPSLREFGIDLRLKF